MNKFKIATIIGSVAVGVALVLGGVGFVAAQTVTPTPPGQEQGGGRPPHGFIDREAIQAVIAKTLGLSVEELQAAKESGKTLEDLATEQGVDIATVRAAIEAARTEAVNKAVAAGTITQAQADKILSHKPGQGGPGGGHGAGRPPLANVIDREAIQAVIANTLGLSVEELQAAKESGKTLEDLATEQGVDIATVRAAIEAARTEAVNKAVTAGTITQAQADKILSHKPGQGGPGGGRPPFGGPNGQRPHSVNPTATPAP